MQHLRGWVYQLPILRGVLKRVVTLEQQLAKLSARVEAMEELGVAAPENDASPAPGPATEAANIYGPRILWELPVQYALRDFVAEGGCALDVGANIGGVAVALSRQVSASGQVHAFEANPFLIPRLRRDLEANGADNVQVVPKAVWRRSGERLRFYCEDSYYAAGSSLLANRVARGSEVEVETVALDDYCLEHRLTPQVIKIDVEGVERAVLEGAAKILQQEAAPAIVLEYSAATPFEDDPLEYLCRFGYKFYDVNLYQPVTREWYRRRYPQPPLVNVLALPARHQPAFACLRLEPVMTLGAFARPDQTEPICLPAAGRYQVAVDFEGPADLPAALGVYGVGDELLAYYEASVRQLQQPSNSRLIIETQPTDLSISVKVRGLGSTGATPILRQVTIARISR